MSFEASNGSSFVLTAVVDRDPRPSYTFEFRKLDPSRSTLLEERVLVNLHGDVGHEFSKPENLTTSLRFAGAPLSPGEYALTRRVTSAGGRNTHVSCFSQGAPVYELKKGQIQLVSVPADSQSRPYEPALLRADAKTLLAAYPNMTAPVSVADRIGTVTYTVAGGREHLCRPTGPIAFIP